jgi:hypothetical protein
VNAATDDRSPASVEHWAAIPGYESTYEVSNLGRVRSIPRAVVQANSWGIFERKMPGVLLRPWIAPAGYPNVNLHGKRHTVHELVALAFLGPRPDGLWIRHLDGDPSNNSPSNLAYGTPSENALDMVSHGTHHEIRRERCPRRHPLAGENLLPSAVKVGKRVCRSCNRAHSEARRRRARGEVVDFQALSDAYYNQMAPAGRRLGGIRLEAATVIPAQRGER